MSRVPLHVVSGAARSGKSALIERLVGARPGWFGLIGREPLHGTSGALRRLPLGCPCCTARIALQVALIGALRDARPERVLLELQDAAHAASLARALEGWPLGQYLWMARRLELPRDATLAPDSLERR